MTHLQEFKTNINLTILDTINSEDLASYYTIKFEKLNSLVSPSEIMKIGATLLFFVAKLLSLNFR